MINPRDIFEGVEFDLDDGIDKVIPRLLDLLTRLDEPRGARLREAYGDVLKSIEYSSVENKDYFFEDLVDAIDWSLPPGWRFGPEEEFSPLYRFTPEIVNKDIIL